MDERFSLVFRFFLSFARCDAGIVEGSIGICIRVVLEVVKDVTFSL